MEDPNRPPDEARAHRTPAPGGPRDGTSSAGGTRDGTPTDGVAEDAEQERRSAAARLFDIRRVIGGLFVAYGLLVGLIGVFDGPAAVDKAEGIRINLWAGLIMFLFGLGFLVWQWRRPVDRD